MVIILAASIVSGMSEPQAKGAWGASPPPKQIRQWQNIAYLHLPAPSRLCLGWRRTRGVPLRIKEYRKACPPASSCLCWQKIRLILKQIYCWVSQDWQAWVQITISELNPAGSEPLGLSLGTPWPPETYLGTWARLPWAFQILLENRFWARTYSKMRKWEKDAGINQISQPWLSLKVVLGSKLMELLLGVAGQSQRFCSCNKKIVMFDGFILKERRHKHS